MREISLPSEPAMCGVSTTFGRSYSGESARQRLGIGCVDEGVEPAGHALALSSASVSTSEPRAVLSSHAPSCMRARRSVFTR